MTVTDDLSARLIRMPLWIGMDEQAIGRVVSCLDATARTPARAASSA